MGNIMKSISGGRYEDIMADDSLTLNVQTPDVAEKVIPEQLSSGTADQMYFALRLATVMLVEKDGEILPLFLTSHLFSMMRTGQKCARVIENRK